MPSQTLYPGLATPLWLYGLMDSSSGGVPLSVDTATASVTLVDQAGNSLGPYGYVFVPGGQSYNGAVYLDGNYRAIIPANAAILPTSLYLGTISITINGGQQTETFQAAAANCASYYTSRVMLEEREGAVNVAVWSNRDNAIPPTANGNPSADPVQLLVAMQKTDAYVNWLASLYKYATPIPATIKQWSRLVDLASDYAAVQLYVARGMFDDAKGPAGKMESRRKELRGFYQGKTKVPGEIEQFFLEGIPDAPRIVGNVTRIPSVVLSPGTAPYGGSKPFTLQPTQIPQLP